MLKQQFHCLHELGVDCLQEGVLRLHLHNNQQLDHLQVLAIDSECQCSTPQRVYAINIDVVLPMGPLKDPWRFNGMEIQ